MAHHFYVGTLKGRGRVMSDTPLEVVENIGFMVLGVAARAGDCLPSPWGMIINPFIRIFYTHSTGLPWHGMDEHIYIL